MQSTTVRPDPLRIWAITDGRTGNGAQALGLAEAIARTTEAEVETRDVVPSAFAARLPAVVWDLASRLLPGWPDAGLAANCPPLCPPWPDLAIGAGRRSAPFVAALRKAGVRTVQILDPRMRASAFDLVVAPEHDRLMAPNAVQTLGSVGRITPQRIAETAAELAPRIAHLPEPRIAILIGGPGPSTRWSERDWDRLRETLSVLSRAGHGLLVTVSRRTPTERVAALAAVCNPARTLFYTGDESPNPYPGVLGHARAVIVTEDSVNMASEAASTGLPVHVFHVAAPSPKILPFFAALAAQGIARDFDGRLRHWTYEPLDEAGRVAKLVLAQLFPDRAPEQG